MRRYLLPALIGLVLLAAAATAATGWLLHAPELVVITTGAAMVLNTALCFGLAAIALLSEVRTPAQRRWIQVPLGAAITIISGLVLAQHVAGLDLDIDWRAMHAWYRDDNPHPGRMSPPTALGFVLLGATLVLMHQVRGLRSGITVQTLTGLVALVGVLGMVSYLLKLPLVYDHYPFRQMALTTAAGFALAGAGLWLSWRRDTWYVARQFIANDAHRISLNSTIVLASIVVVSMLAGLGVMQRQVEALARESLLWPLEGRTSLFGINIDLRASHAAIFASRPDFALLMRRLNESPADAIAFSRLRENAEALLPLGFRGIAFLTVGGRERLRVGWVSERPAVALALKTAPYANTLMWSDESFVLQTRVPVLAGGETIGMVVVEQRLAALSAALDRSNEFAATGEVTICGRQEEQLACFPQRNAPESFTVPYDPGLPVARGLASETGVMIARDVRGVNVIAAHGPVGTTGLGMAIKMDTAELYAPLREALYFMLALGVLLVTCGALLLYWGVVPLVHKLYLGDQRLRLALDSSRSAWWDWDISAGTIELSEHWKAMLGEPARVTVTTLDQLEKLVHPDDLPLLQRKLRIALKSWDLRYDVEHRVRRPDGEWIWILSVGRVVERDAHDRAVRMIGINADISQRKESALRIEHQARYDGLTELPNRATFHDRLGHSMARARRNKTLIAVMYLDIDGFKNINDSFGHAVGDELLKDFAQRLAYCMRAVDTVARMGGDEFAVILEELRLRDDGCRIAEKIVLEMQPEFPLERHTVEITTSVGIAFYDGEQSLGPDQLVGNADAALYEAKNGGRNTYRVAG